jgi:hypothetical protein
MTARTTTKATAAATATATATTATATATTATAQYNGDEITPCPLAGVETDLSPVIKIPETMTFRQRYLASIRQ